MLSQSKCLLIAGLSFAVVACTPAPAATPTPAPARPPANAAGAPAGGAGGGVAPNAGAPQGAGQGNPQGAAQAPRPYRQVITERAVTQTGLFKIHRIAERLYFEIPTAALNKEMLLISRPVESTLQDPAGFFGGGMRAIVQWERSGDRVVLRAKEHDLIADSTAAIWRQVSGFRKGPVLATFTAATYGPDSAAVVDVSELFLSSIPELQPVEGAAQGQARLPQVIGQRRLR